MVQARHIRVWISLPLAVIGAVAGGADPGVIRWEGRTMGSPYVVQLVGAELAEGQVEALQLEIECTLEEINRQMSHYRPESELSRFNGAPAHTPFKVSPEFAQVVRFALALSRRSEGAFDPTLAPVVNLWGFGEVERPPGEPPADQLQAALEKTGWRHVAVTANDELVKEIPGLALNLSAVAKGFAVDEMGRVLRRHGLTDWYVSIAGEVLVSGHNAQGAPWRIGIAAPTDRWRETDLMAAGVLLSDQAIATSGDYQKFFTGAGGERFSHILDPRSGRPVQESSAGVSVVASDCMTADGLATALFVLGPERGRAFVETWAGAAALFITRGPEGRFALSASGGFPRLIEVTGSER